MPVTKSLTLYSTDGCHLCESAERMLRSMPELRRVTLDVVDIVDDATLLARYGTTRSSNRHAPSSKSSTARSRPRS